MKLNTAPSVNTGVERRERERERRHLLNLQLLTFWMPDSLQGQKPSLGGYTDPLANMVFGATKRYVGIPSISPDLSYTSSIDLKKHMKR